jgi:hypothetical protein
MRVTELKGQRHEIFDFRGFFPQAPKYTIKAISNFFKNFRRNLQICHRCRWYNGAPWFANISANFSKNIEITLTLFSGAWGKMIHEKNLKQKISWHCPFKERKFVLFEYRKQSIESPSLNTKNKAYSWPKTVSRQNGLKREKTPQVSINFKGAQA